MISAQDNQPANNSKELTEFVQSLLLLTPQEAAMKLNSRFLANESADQAAFNHLVRRVEQVEIRVRWYNRSTRGCSQRLTLS